MELNCPDYLSNIKLKNPEDITSKELSEFQLVIEKAMGNLNKLQEFHRKLTGIQFVPPIRLR